ncbi:DUF2004 domain-containing protein [Microbacterium sp. STN6]|uniref:DUF2004 domain-containing protein n=1 Tax=Microbacterium sp. STN6 TaxID=2995588 RepID=UPI002260DA4F|nr:DUF2004 domain-containing protein [Microbacterium sp. STN6]MCX7522106.1 DUF2004 domain-containing protein [Microbacterium sp. STN6]
MAIEHDFFGIIDADAAGALTWADTLEVADQSVEVELSAANQARVSEHALDQAAAMLHALEPFDAKARDALVAELSERGSVTTDYVDQQVQVLGESLIDVLVHNSGDVPLDVLRSLQLVRVLLKPENDDDEETFAEFEYSLSPDDTDDMIMVGFNIGGEVVATDTREGWS